MTDLVRELAIRVVGWAMRCALIRVEHAKERTVRLQKVLAKLINGRSARQVEKMERERGLR